MTYRQILASALLSAVPTILPAAELPTASELLDRSIEYHDPGGSWGTSALELYLDETRPDGGVRKTDLLIDLPRETFVWNSQRHGRDVGGRVTASGCQATLDGSTDFTDEEAEKFRLSCDRVTWIRDYYTYLYGLPMKLRDPGTLVDDEVTSTEFDGREVLALKVTYEAGVGGDTWYFYFDPETSALAGYRFYHDEAKNDGEYVTIEGEVELGGMKLPEIRAWYYNDGRGYLGTDTLVGNRSVVE